MPPLFQAMQDGVEVTWQMLWGLNRSITCWEGYVVFQKVAFKSQVVW